MATFEALIKDIDTKFFSSIYNAARQASQEIVAELQQAGPNWSGEFSNSWQIKESENVVSGNGVKGDPVAIIFPKALKSLRKLKNTDVIVFEIGNTSTHKDLAMDKVEGVFKRPSRLPQTSLGRAKFDEVNQGRKQPSFRKDIGSGGFGSSSRTAVQDWYPDYVGSGRIERIIQTQLSSLVQRLQ